MWAMTHVPTSRRGLHVTANLPNAPNGATPGAT